MAALDPGSQEAVHRLWDELTDFEASQTAEAARHLQGELCRLSDVWNARWAAGVRVSGEYGDDPLEGWRLIGPQLLHPISPQPVDAKIKEFLTLLLTEVQEKEIADQFDQAASTVHQYVIGIYRKFGVRSRTGLMTLWLNRAG
jgi:hypothetical protein